MHRRVAIIGGGAAAAALLGELLERQTPQALHLDWYTGGGTPARGVAYGTRSDRHLLNVRAASMSLFAGKPQGFLDFVQREDPSIAGTDFLPRRRYGEPDAPEPGDRAGATRNRPCAPRSASTIRWETNG